MNLPRRIKHSHLLTFIVIVLAALLALPANAQTLTTAGKARGAAPPQVAAPCVLDAGSITQSADCSIVQFFGIACAQGGVTRETQYLRRFSLTGDHGILTPYTVSSVDFGVEVDTPDPTNPITVNTYKIPIGAPFLYGSMTLLDSAVVELDGTNDLTLVNAAVGGTVDPLTDDLVVELVSFDHVIEGGGFGAFFPGANPLGQSGPSYIASAACGLFEPTDLADIGFLDSHNVLVVNGTAVPPFAKTIFVGNDFDFNGIPDKVVEVGSQFFGAYYIFRIGYYMPQMPPVMIKDVVPREWNALGGNAYCELVRADERRNLFSDSFITCYPPVGIPSEMYFEASARCFDVAGDPSCHPKECGAFFLNEGATMQVWRTPLDVTDPLCLAAVRDLNGFGLVYDGTGDEDGDGVDDYTEACVNFTDPCSAPLAPSR